MMQNYIKISFSFLFFFTCYLSPVAYHLNSYAQLVKEPNVSGAFYPDDLAELSLMIDGFLQKANPQPMPGEIFALILPHAGYGYSGPTAAFGYKLIQGKNYKTVIILGASHHYSFSGVSVYPQGAFRTPLGEVEIDSDFTGQLMKDKGVVFEPLAFSKEHSVEVQIPFLQKSLNDFKIVPIVLGDCTWQDCQNLAQSLKNAIANRKDVLIIVSTDMYHGYDYEEADRVDNSTIDFLKKMDSQSLYYALREGHAQLCGGFGAVAALILAKELGHNQIEVLNHTNSAQAADKKIKGAWAVGYASLAIDNPKGEKAMLNQEQRKKLLGIARKSMETYLKTGSRLEIKESDPALTQISGAFVTLHKRGHLRGCIGSIIGSQPLYLTVRDMAVESATSDPRFPPVSLDELNDIEIEISALSVPQKIDSADKIDLGKHGVIIKRGFKSGVFLPQVAAETGWSKEEFLSQLCSRKAGLPADAWKDKATQIQIFSAEVFSEKDL